MQPIRESVRLIGLAGLVATRMALAGDVVVDGKLISTASSGAPLEVASEELVSGLNADLLEGMNASELAAAVDHVLVVAKSGGQYSSIQAAIDSIVDAAADNRYLVWVGPGTYNEKVQMKSWVALEGAGESATTIRSDGSVPGTLWAGAAAEIRRLTVEADGTSPIGGIGLGNDCVADIKHVKVKATAVGGNVAGIYSDSCDSVTLSDVEVSASTSGTDGIVRGIYLNAVNSVSLWRVEAEASGGAETKALFCLVPADAATLVAHAWAVSAEHVEAHSWGGAILNEALEFDGGTSDGGPVRLARVTANAEGGSMARGLVLTRVDATLNSVDVTVHDSTSLEAAYFDRGMSGIFQSRLRTLSAAAPGVAVNVALDATVEIVYSQLEGTLSNLTTGQYACLGNYDGSLGVVTCPL